MNVQKILEKVNIGVPIHSHGDGVFSVNTDLGPLWITYSESESLLNLAMAVTTDGFHATSHLYRQVLAWNNDILRGKFALLPDQKSGNEGTLYVVEKLPEQWLSSQGIEACVQSIYNTVKLSRERLASIRSPEEESILSIYSHPQTPLCAGFGRDLTKEALEGQIDPRVGRDDELLQLMEVLLRKERNNPLILGEAGVGKTALIEKLAQKIVNGEAPEALLNKKIVEIDLGSLFAGCSEPQKVIERLDNLIKEAETRPDLILYIDELHLVMGKEEIPGVFQINYVANMFKPALARGKMRLIGATTLDDYNRYVKNDKALARRFQPINLDEPSPEVSTAMLRALRPRFESHHGIKIPEYLIEHIISVAKDGIMGRRFPDKAFDLLDQAAAKANIMGAAELTKSHLEAVIQQQKHLHPFLSEYGRNLTQMAKDGKFHPVVGRDAEIREIIEILLRSQKNNPLLLGEPGVGKTAIVEGLALKIANGEAPEKMIDWQIIEISTSSIVAGTIFRGTFEEKMLKLVKELEANQNLILFIDEFHTVVGAGATVEDMTANAANLLKPYLTGGKIKCIGATTLAEYRRHIEKDVTLARRFQPVRIEEPTEEAAFEMVKAALAKEEKQDVEIPEEVIREAIVLSTRYIKDRFIPDKAIELIEQAAAKVKMENFFQVTKKDLTDVVSKRLCEKRSFLHRY